MFIIEYQMNPKETFFLSYMGGRGNQWTKNESFALIFHSENEAEEIRRKHFPYLPTSKITIKSV